MSRRGATTYGWNQLDQLTSVDDGSQEVGYDYDALGRQATRDNGSAIRLTHYGDLSDVPILDTNAEGQPTMSYVQGPEGLIEQRSGEATIFPLPDAHGDIATIADAAGEVASRQAYDPWGAQLSGPSLEMGWLGAQQRRSDPATGLNQMGVRPYSPELGNFIAEDPMLGHIGTGVTMNRYPYAWDNPANLYDLDGRDVCAPTPFGDACAGDAAEGGWDKTAGARDFVGVAGDGNGGWLSEAPGFANDRAMDLLKEIDFSTEEFIVALAGAAGGIGICGIAAIGASAVGTPAAGTGAAVLCVAIETIGTTETVNDIFDSENRLPTDEFFK